MSEAVEICKLRLFLKLVSQVDSRRQLEPLPDIDFNIRVGNTLIGYATEEQFDHSNTLASDQKHRADIKHRVASLAILFERFRSKQGAHDGHVPASEKRELREALSELSVDLDRYLAHEYGVNAEKPRQFAAWRESHMPFHWFAEFYAVMRTGGFDVVIGNPPYVEYAKVKDQYTLGPGFEAYSSNLFAACCFRASQLGRKAVEAFIVPISLPSTDRMQPLREELARNSALFHVDFNTRPGKLFEGAEQRLTIYIRMPSDSPVRFSGGYLNWNQAERDALFQLLSFVDTSGVRLRNGIWPKVGSEMELGVLTTLLKSRPLSATSLLGGAEAIYYKNTGLRYFNSATLRPPKCWINGVATSSSRETTLAVSKETKPLVHCALLSSTFFFFWQAASNCRDLNPSDIHFFPVPSFPPAVASELRQLSKAAEKDYVSKGKIITMQNKKTGTVELERSGSAKLNSAIGGNSGH